MIEFRGLIKTNSPKATSSVTRASSNKCVATFGTGQSQPSRHSRGANGARHKDGGWWLKRRFPANGSAEPLFRWANRAGRSHLKFPLKFLSCASAPCYRPLGSSRFPGPRGASQSTTTTQDRRLDPSLCPLNHKAANTRVCLKTVGMLSVLDGSPSRPQSNDSWPRANRGLQFEIFLPPLTILTASMAIFALPTLPPHIGVNQLK